MAKPKISFGKETVLQNMWVILNYFLMLISNIIPQ